MSIITKGTIYELRNDFSESINYAKENEEIVILLNELRELNQECEGTFKIKDRKVTEINVTGIALVPRFRDKDGDKEWPYMILLKKWELLI